MVSFAPELDIYEREAALRLGPLMARAAREELAAHLDADYHARLEFGVAPKDARIQALAALGDLRSIGRREPQGAFVWPLFAVPILAAVTWRVNESFIASVVGEHLLFLSLLLGTIFVSLWRRRVRFFEFGFGGIVAAALYFSVDWAIHPHRVSPLDLATGWILFTLPLLLVHILSAACARDLRARRQARG